jgi:phosphoglycolate phosphatase-like HAD superfamily hydrolase
MYDGLLLDHDGVVVTLSDPSALRAAARRALRDAGVDDPDPEAVERLRIRVSAPDLRAVSRRYDLDPDRLWRYRDDRVRDALLAEVRTGSKVPYDDVGALGSVGGPLGIASNNQTRIVETVLDRYDLSGQFGTVRARAPHPDSLDRKKPNPTFLEEAMADLGVGNPLYVGDSESDVVAGRRAGLDVAFLRRAHNADTELDHGPTYEVGGLDEVAAIVADRDVPDAR